MSRLWKEAHSFLCFLLVVYKGNNPNSSRRCTCQCEFCSSGHVFEGCKKSEEGFGGESESERSWCDAWQGSFASPTPPNRSATFFWYLRIRGQTAAKMVRTGKPQSDTQLLTMSQSAQNSKGIQTLLDVRTTIYPPSLYQTCKTKSRFQAEREAQKIVQKGTLSKARNRFYCVPTDDLQLENVNFHLPTVREPQTI